MVSSTPLLHVGYRDDNKRSEASDMHSVNCISHEECRRPQNPSHKHNYQQCSIGKKKLFQATT